MAATARARAGTAGGRRAGQPAGAPVPETAAADPAGAQAALEATRAAQHPRCLFCGRDDPLGFRLGFQVVGRGSVRAALSCSRLLQSYPGIVHGGIISAVLDAAMTNCLFSVGKAAVTGELRVRYLRPVCVEGEVEVAADVVRTRGSLHFLSAELRQNGSVLARATAKFLERPAETSG